MKMFDGPDYDKKLDFDRLIGQTDKILKLMLDGVWRTTDEISQIIGEKNSRSVEANLRNLRKEKFGSYVVSRRYRDGIRGLSEYRLLEPSKKFHQPDMFVQVFSTEPQYH